FNVLQQEPKPPSTYRPDLDARLEKLCLKALAKKPADRFPAVAAFAAALRSWLTAQTGPGDGVTAPAGSRATARPRGQAGRPAATVAPPTARKTVAAPTPAATVRQEASPPARGWWPWLLAASAGVGLVAVLVVAWVGWRFLRPDLPTPSSEPPGNPRADARP